MKVTKEVLEQMKSDIKTVLDYYLVVKPKFEDLYKSDYFTIWSWVWMNRRYNDSNLNVRKGLDGKRLLEYNPDYEIYPCNTNDETLETALRSILEKLLN